jgi:hypothetical protein
LASDRDTTVYVVLNVGETNRVAGDTEAVWMKPSDHVRVHGAAPVRTAEIVVLWPAQIVAVPETTAVGCGITLRVAEAVPPVPPFVDVTLPVTLFFVPEVVATTATVIEQEAPGVAIAPPVKETLPLPATAVKVPPQVFVAAGVPATTTPAGKLSVTPTPVRPTGFPAGFVIVIVSVEGSFSATVAGEKDFAIVGGASNVSVSVAELFAGVGSVTPPGAATVAVFASVPVAVGATVQLAV